MERLVVTEKNKTRKSFFQFLRQEGRVGERTSSKLTRSNRRAFRKGNRRKGSCVELHREDLVVEVVGQLELEE